MITPVRNTKKLPSYDVNFWAEIYFVESTYVLLGIKQRLLTTFFHFMNAHIPCGSYQNDMSSEVRYGSGIALS